MYLAPEVYVYISKECRTETLEAFSDYEVGNT